MRLDKVIKVKFNKTLIDNEAVKHVREMCRKYIGEEYTYVICQDGMDIEPVGTTYWGLQVESGQWVLDKCNNVKWYPCRQLAEIDRKQIGEDIVIVVPFNGISEIDGEKLLKEYQNGLFSPGEAYEK